MAWYVGLMSGTSLDGVDAVLAEVDETLKIAVARAHLHRPFDASLKAELFSLNTPGSDELHRAAIATNRLMDVYAEAATSVLQQAGLQPRDVRALGAHGQTVRHRPRDLGPWGYTLQLCNGARLAEATGIDVICDFRSRDVAAGGEGAPLVPAFHAARFGQSGINTAVLNLGGIANLTLLHADGRVGGFDTGPGNVLMDLWCLRHLGTAYDAGGQWAATGQVDEVMLQAWLTEPYFHRPPPKSTGRDLFHAEWLAARVPAGRRPEDIMATLSALTARSVGLALRGSSGSAWRELVVCGGGARNAHLLQGLQAEMAPGTTLRISDDLGVPCDQVEALAFAWLAAAWFARRAGNLTAVTGALGPRVLGALYPAQ